MICFSSGLCRRGQEAEGLEVAAALQLAGNGGLADREADAGTFGNGGHRRDGRRDAEADGSVDAGDGRDDGDSESSRQEGQTLGRTSKKRRMRDIWR